MKTKYIAHLVKLDNCWRVVLHFPDGSFDRYHFPTEYTARAWAARVGAEITKEIH
jgi:hypothetical protein